MLIVVYDVNVLLIALTTQRGGFDKVNSPVTGLEWPTGFQEVKVPRFHNSGTGWW